MQDKTPPEFKEVEWIGKPASPATILGVLDLMMAKQQLRRDLMAEAAERRHRAAELARVSERLEQVQLPSIAAAIRDLSHYNTIRGLEQDAKAGSLKPLRRDDEG
jgi:chromosome segregation and condensation protein ScpB